MNCNDASPTERDWPGHSPYRNVSHICGQTSYFRAEPGTSSHICGQTSYFRAEPGTSSHICGQTSYRVVLRFAAGDTAYPDMRGLSRSNIKYMRQMAAAWPEPAIGQQPVGQLPWGHVTVLLGKLDEPDARDWYARAAVAGGWSRNVLLNQIKGQAHARAVAAPSNFELTLAGEDSELAAQIARDPYVFDFLGLSGRVAERELEAALVAPLGTPRPLASSCAQAGTTQSSAMRSAGPRSRWRLPGTPTTRCHRPNGPPCPVTPGWPRPCKPPSTWTAGR